MIKVSVIVPVYNGEEYLRMCIDSLICQTLYDIEMIFIDDKSTDNSLSVLCEYQKQDQRIKIISNKGNVGAAESRNRGLDIAKGEYIQFVDADDYLEINALEELYIAAKCQNADMCYMGMQFDLGDNMDESGVQHSILRKYEGVFDGKELIRYFTENEEFFLYLCSIFYKNSFIKKYGLRYKKLKIGEGGNFILCALCHAERVIVCEEKYYHYRVHSASVTHSLNAKKELLIGQLVQYIDILKYFSQHEEAVGLLTFLKNQYRKMAGGLQNLSFNEKKEIEKRMGTDFSKHVFRMLLPNDKIYNIKFDDGVTSRIKKEKHVIIYGAGYASKEIIGLLQEHAIEIIGFAVTIRDERHRSIYGHHVYEIQELVQYNSTSIVLVASNKKYNLEIKKTLEKYGFNDYIFLNVEI